MSEDAPHREVPVQRVGREGGDAGRDLVAVEEPLEVRLHGTPFAVVMRTPGHDRDLAAGFLLSEGVVRGVDDIGAVERCRHPDAPGAHNVVDVYLFGPAAATLDGLIAARRHVAATSACGVCGRVSIDALRTRAPRVAAANRFDGATLAALPARLREHQRVFDGTGGLHGAALCTPDGTIVRAAEDVGRHNAVDKVIGAMLLEDRLPLAGHALVVSGRTSFEIVQKAWLAGVELVCAVSAPSSLAIDLAQEAGITLLGFVREGGFNVYAGAGRVVHRTL